MIFDLMDLQQYIKEFAFARSLIAEM